MVYAIFLSFYPHYSKKSLQEFELLLREMNDDFELIVVNNNTGGNPVSYSGEILNGSNVNWEFSGWDVGLDRIGSLQDSDFVIFCNDTFCIHRTWTSSDRRRFAKAFQSLIDSGQKGICGELHKLRSGEGFGILGKFSNCWASTYLFGMSAEILKRIGGRVCLSEDILSKLVQGASSQSAALGDDITENLREHILRWMYPVKKGDGWYKAASASSDLKLRKIKTIMNELYLSAACSTEGGVFVSAVPPRIVRGLIRVKRLLIQQSKLKT